MFLVTYSFFNRDSLHARLNSHYKTWSYKKKKHKKIKAYKKSLQKEPTATKCLLILHLKPFRSFVKGKHSIGRKLQSLPVRGKKMLTQTLLQHKNQKTHATYQNNEQISLENRKVEPVELVQMNSDQSNTYRNDLSWLNFDDEPLVQERKQVKEQQSCIFTFEAYLTISSSNQKQQPIHGHMIDTEVQSNLRRNKLHRASQGSNFLRGSFSDRDTRRAPIRFRTERQPQHLQT